MRYGNLVRTNRTRMDSRKEIYRKKTEGARDEPPLLLRGRGRSASANRRERLDVEIEGELPRMGTEVDGLDLVLHLVGDPGLDHVRREHVSLQEVLMVSL